MRQQCALVGLYCSVGVCVCERARLCLYEGDCVSVCTLLCVRERERVLVCVYARMRVSETGC